MPFDIDAARQRGYSDEEIGRYLSTKLYVEGKKFDYDSAIKQGKTPAEVADYLSQFDPEEAYRSPESVALERVPEWGRKYPNLYGSFGAMKTLYEQIGRPMLEAGGMVAGGAAGVPGGPTTSIAGGAAGYAMAKQLDRWITGQINELEGIKNKTTVEEEALESLKNYKEGLLIEMTGRALPVFGAGVVEKVTAPFKKAMTPEAEYVRDLARGIGVEYTPAEATGSKLLSTTESLLEGAPGSGDIIRDFRFRKQLAPLMAQREKLIEQGASEVEIHDLGVKIYQQVNDFLERQTQLSGKRLNQLRDAVLARIGTNASYESLGRGVQESLAANREAIMERKRQLYNAIGDDLGDFKAFPNTMHEWAQEEMEVIKNLPKGSRGEATQYLDWAAKKYDVPPSVMKEIEKLPPNVRAQIEPDVLKEYEVKYSWKELQKMRDDLTGLLRKENPYADVSNINVNELTPEGRIYFNLRKSLDTDLKLFAQSGGSDAWASYQTARAFYRENIGEVWKKKEIRRLFMANPEKVIDVAVRPNSTSEIKLLKKALGPIEFEQVQRGFANRLLGVDKFETFDPRNLRSQIMRYGDSTINEIFGKNASAILRTIAKEGIKLDIPSAGLPFIKSLARQYPETVVDAIIGAPETRLQSRTMFYNLSAVKASLTPETWNALEESLIEKILSVDQASGHFVPEQFSKTFYKYGDVLKWLDREKYQQLEKLANVSRKLGRASQIAKTAGGVKERANTIIGWSTYRILFRNPITGIIETLGTRPLAKLYLSKTGIKLLTDGFSVPENTKKGVEIAAKLSQIIKSDNAREESPPQEEK